MTPPPSSPSVKLGLFSANLGSPTIAAQVTETATLAEELGMESLWTGEHIAIPAHYDSRYPYAVSGETPMPADQIDLPDPLIWLAYAAAVTHHIRLATGITVLPLRNPLVAAKQIATLDALSGGRVILGVGVGWLAEEFTAVGVPFAGRGRRHDDHLAAMRALWHQDVATVHNDHVTFDAVISKPTPVGQVPVVIGGSSIAAATRAARLGDGYFPGGNLGLTDLRHRIALIAEECTRAGRDPAAVEITVYTALTDVDALVAQISDLTAIGVSRVLLEHLPHDQLHTVVTELSRRIALTPPAAADEPSSVNATP